MLHSLKTVFVHCICNYFMSHSNGKREDSYLLVVMLMQVWSGTETKNDAATNLGVGRVSCHCENLGSYRRQSLQQMQNPHTWHTLTPELSHLGGKSFSCVMQPSLWILTKLVRAWKSIHRFIVGAIYIGFLVIGSEIAFLFLKENFQ